MTRQPPPTRDAITEKKGELSMPWLLFFNQTFNGDSGATWTPTFTNLTSVGTPTFTGRYYQISSFLTYFNVLITPGTNTSSTAGTTYINNFPLTVNSTGFCLSLSNNIGGALGVANSTNNRIYTPGWTTVTTPINVIGIIEAS